MGTKFMAGAKAPRIGPPGQNLEARAFGAPSFTAVRSGGAASKDIASAMALTRMNKLKPLTGSNAYAPSSKKI